MKRSEINKALKDLEAMCAKYHCYLPPFCHMTPEDWQSAGHEYDEIRDCMLGWDITDFGLGNFDKFGFSLITIRNGCRTNEEKYPKVYAEKLLYLKEGQMAANHFHWFKTEDIINRGGGNCLIRVYNSLPNEEIDYESDVTVHMDGRTYVVPAGTQMKLTPGESIWITQGMYHDFAVEEGSGPVLLGEVSQCNDDNTDNRFNPPVGRFPKIEEDEAPYRLLCNEYPCPDIESSHSLSQHLDVIDTRCGLRCAGCGYQSTCGCGGCIATNGHPFHGECPVAACCQEKGFLHCGECPQIPCELLTQYSCDPEHGDNPQGARIEQCKKWFAERHGN